MPGASKWKATDEVPARQVTVRVLTPGLPVTAEVFEAVRAAARLADPRLARVFDADHCCEHPYVVSERTSGERLDDLLTAKLQGPRGRGGHRR